MQSLISGKSVELKSLPTLTCEPQPEGNSSVRKEASEDELGMLNIAPEEPDTCDADRDLQS
jgi:hypothetical protein